MEITKESIIKDLRQAIKELNSIICSPDMAKVLIEAAARDLDIFIESCSARKPKKTDNT